MKKYTHTDHNMEQRRADMSANDWFRRRMFAIFFFLLVGILKKASITDKLSRRAHNEVMKPPMAQTEASSLFILYVNKSFIFKQLFKRSWNFEYGYETMKTFYDPGLST